jgi:hypothetical protein
MLCKDSGEFFAKGLTQIKIIEKKFAQLKKYFVYLGIAKNKNTKQ